MSSSKGKKKEISKFENLYRNYYKFLIFIPIALVILSTFFIIKAIDEDGTPIYRDVSLRGGVEAVVEELYPQGDVLDLRERIENDYPENSVDVSEVEEAGELSGYTIKIDLEEEEGFREYLSEIFETQMEMGENYNSNFISPTLSNMFFIQVIWILVFSFVLMSIVVFAYFREIVPAGTVILSIIFDLIVTVGLLNMFSFSISIAGIGALLMIIGYSIDTDILLTNRLVREKGKNYMDKAYDAWKTGTLMSVTTITAGIIAMIVTNSPIIFEIALILVVGLIVDYISTWIQNTYILLKWLEKFR